MLIVDTLHKSKDIEAYGTGIPRIRDACRDAGIEFEYKRVPIGACFIFHRKDAFADNPELQVRDSSGKVREKFGETLSKSELAAAEYIEINGAVSSSEIMGLLEITDRGAQRLLKRLVEKDVVEKIGTGRNTRYRLMK
jgi:ATP-dependent DNA helicase RecG